MSKKCVLLREEVCPLCDGTKLDPDATGRIACPRCIGAGHLRWWGPPPEDMYEEELLDNAREATRNATGLPRRHKGT